MAIYKHNLPLSIPFINFFLLNNPIDGVTRMNVPKCPQCGIPVQAADVNIRAMQVSCRHCGYEGRPPSAGASSFGKLKIEKMEPRDPFGEEFSPQSLSPKLALMAFFASATFLWFPEFQWLTTGSLLLFVLFASMSLFFRFREG
jgi:hypothetical protein